MNLRFSKKDVRVRISLAEAQQLQQAELLTEELPLADTSLSMSIALRSELEQPAAFSLTTGHAATLLRRHEFLELLHADLDRDSAITAPLNRERPEGPKLIFEIDLFSAKRKAPQ